MRANATLRAYSGFMIFFLAFLLRTVHFGHVPDKAALGEMIGAAAVGGFIGTAIGAGLRSRAPQAIVFGMLTLAMITTAICAAFFGLWAALVVALAAALGQTLVKLALDSILQREIGEEIAGGANLGPEEREGQRSVEVVDGLLHDRLGRHRVGLAVHRQQHQDQGLQIPPWLAPPRGHGLSGLLPNLRREKLPHEFHQRLWLLQSPQLPCCFHRRSSLKGLGGTNPSSRRTAIFALPT